MTYDRLTLMWQPRPTTALPGTAKSYDIQTSVAPEGPWVAGKVVGLASRNSRCREFTDVSKLPGVPGKDGDCVLLTYRIEQDTQYVKAYAVATDGTKSVASNTLYLPESHVGASFFLLVLAIMLFIGTDPNHPTRRR